MNLILLSKDDFTLSETCVRLTDRRHKHIRSVLKAPIGRELCVGIIGGMTGRGRVLKIDEESVDLEVSIDRDPPLPLPITLILALPRPIVFKRVLYHAAALGVKKLILINANRVDKSYWKSAALSDENIRDRFILGLEQAKDTILPEVSFRTRFKPFVEEDLPALAKSMRVFLAHPEAEDISPAGYAEPSAVVIGPEGGFIPYEIERLKSAGCEIVCFGRRVLRVEAAVITAIARLSCQ